MSTPPERLPYGGESACVDGAVEAYLNDGTLPDAGAQCRQDAGATAAQAHRSAAPAEPRLASPADPR